MISTNLQHLVLLKGRVSMILTVSPMLQSFFSSCAWYFLVRTTNLPYNGCFTRLTSETTIDFSILLEVTTPILSFLKFLFSILQKQLLLLRSFGKLGSYPCNGSPCASDLKRVLNRGNGVSHFQISISFLSLIKFLLQLCYREFVDFWLFHIYAFML